MLSTDDMSILAGVTSRNSVVILKTGKGLDTDAAYKKFGISYSMSLSKSEGQSQALRGLVELAVIELMGKLTKTPYWTCLGAEPKGNDEVRLEMADWYYAMAASRVDRTLVEATLAQLVLKIGDQLDPACGHGRSEEHTSELQSL